jgi:hypothetical protein
MSLNPRPIKSENRIQRPEELAASSKLFYSNSVEKLVS